MAEQGILQVRVFTSRARIPVPGAAVAVTRRTPDGRHNLLVLRETDESGRIQAIPFPAPAPAESTQPGEPRPYAVCDVWVEHPSFNLLHVDGVQIFPGVVTEQNAELIPLPEHAAATDLETSVQITPQPL